MFKLRDARGERGASLLELITVIAILGILFAIAVAIFSNQTNKAKDTDAKSKISIAAKNAKSIWSSNDQNLPSPVATLVANLQAAAPEVSFAAGTAFTAGTVSVQENGIDDVTLQTQSASGQNYAVRYIYSGPGAGTYRTTGASAVGQTNFSVNPSIEVDTSNWASVNSATLTRTGAESTTGVYSLKVDTPGAVINEGVRTNSMAVSASSTYSALVSVKAPNTVSISVSLQELDAGNTVVGTTTQTIAGNGGWQAASATRAFGGTGVNARVRVLTGAMTATTFYIDGVLVEQSASPDPYFDGDYPGGSWIGSLHTSTSTAYPWASW